MVSKGSRFAPVHDDLISQARRAKLWRGAVEDLATHLPAEAEETTRLLDGLVAARDNEAFTPLLLAALHAGRVVPARLLVEGFALLPHPGFIVSTAFKFEGNVAEALVKAVDRGGMGTEREIICLLLAVLWCEESKSSHVDLPPVIHAARHQARNPFLKWVDRLSLCTVAEWTADKGLRTILAPNYPPNAAETARVTKERLLTQGREPVLSVLPDQPPPDMISGFTVRRAVARIGRNDPCPCGSGKKHKHCCLGKNHERLAHSSPVPGLTLEEFKAQREHYLTADDIHQMRSYEVVKVDPTKLPRALLPPLVNRLLTFQECERAVQLFETVGLAPPIEGHWEDVLHEAGIQKRVDLLKRLIQLKPGFDPAGQDVGLEVRLALLQDTTNPVLDLLEDKSLEALRPSRRSGPLVDIGYYLLKSRYPALGILVARGIVPILNVLDAESLHDLLHEARDRLNLDFGDPIDGVMDLCSGEASDIDAEESAELSLARKNVEEKKLEVSRIRQELDRVRAELEKSTAAPPPAPVLPVTPSPQPTVIPDPAAQALRQRVEELRGELKARHEERNALRRELERVTGDLESMRRASADAAPTAVPEVPEDGAALFREVEFETNQPVRIPQFAERFQQALAGVPKPVARAALLLTGRLAAGQPAAFVGLKKLEANPQILRQRVGSDYRLLFRLDARNLHVLALVNRRELDRQIRNLFATS
jgi:hypothetical protein